MTGAGAALLRHRVIAATASAATVVLVAGCAFAATSSHGSGQAKLAAVGDSKPVAHKTPTKTTTRPVPPAGPLRVISSTPGRGARDVNGGSAIRAKDMTRTHRKRLMANGFLQ